MAQEELQEMGMGTFPKPMELSPADLKKECIKTMENSSVHLLCNETWSEADLSGANPRLPKDLVPPLQPHSLLHVTDPALSPALVAPWRVRQHLGGLALPGGTAGKPRVAVFHTGYLLPLPAALFWEQFHHLTINILGTETLSTSLLVISVFL